MMTANEIRQKFLEFFASKNHKIVNSAPIVVKDDPTLMFTNAGMNQFKDYFLGNKRPDNPRLADTQKCLRVSGKHNDLEEVGVDTYHHTMFEMLGNWSIGDYFKAEAIAWSWELLTEVYKLDKDRLYVTVFEGDPAENLPPSRIALAEWRKLVQHDHIVFGNKKDNFWEMGETGPCGPCSEIHYDLRDDDERDKVPGHLLVNKDNPQVIEIWNNVFIQYNRKADGTLEPLPAMHVDTGMGLERLVRAIQNKKSNYDTDLFTTTISGIESKTGKTYHFGDTKQDIAFRVLADHLRAISFTIADGQLPSNTGAGYVIRRILRRAVRYYFSYLDYKEPLLCQLVDTLAKQFEFVFPELIHQKTFVERVIREEEKSFLKTLDSGLRRLDEVVVENNFLDGKTAFELYDTYGFPIDLTRLIASEKGWNLDEEGFEKALQEQKDRSRADSRRETGDWIVIHKQEKTEFLGYDHLKLENVFVVKYRVLKQKETEFYQLVLNKTPFYPEGGGQVGDTGLLIVDNEIIRVLDTRKENDLIVHFVDRIPDQVGSSMTAEVDAENRFDTQRNHSATHLLHAALREVLGKHVTQKGSLVRHDCLRFDISHFQKISREELYLVEKLVNEKIRNNIFLQDDRNVPLDKARETGAMMLFGEKYGETVRVITFDPGYSRELCGGCHVKATGEIGHFRIISEGAIAAGVRRIEAVTGQYADKYCQQYIDEVQVAKTYFKGVQSLVKSISELQEENQKLKKDIEKWMAQHAHLIKDALLKKAEPVNGQIIIRAIVENLDSKSVKTLAFQLEKELGDAVVLLGFMENGKANIMLTISESLVKSKGYNAGQIIRQLAQPIQGGGGGHTFFASAGGADPEGLVKSLNMLSDLLT